MSRQSTWIKGSQGCVAPLPFLSLATWECFLSLATASSCARMGCVTHHSSAQRDGIPQALGVWGTHPRQSNSLQTSAMQCQGLMLHVALPAQAFQKTAWTQAKPEEPCHAGPHRYQQGCTCDLLLSQPQNEGKGHRDVQIRSNQEQPFCLHTELAKHPSLYATLPARQKPPIQCLPVPRAWAEHLPAGKR